MDNELSPYHPQNDPRLTERHSWYTDNPANDPMFLFNVIDAIEEGDEELEEFVRLSFEAGNLSWMYHDGQRKMSEMISLPLLEFLIFCSRQLGKSFFILCFAIEHCAKLHKGRRPLVRIFCQTQRQVNDIVQDNMQIIQAIAPEGWIKRTKSENRWTVGLGEIRVGMMSAAHVHGKRGGNATLIITEEGCFSPSEGFKEAVQLVLSPQLLRSEGKMVHVTTASEDEHHHMQAVIKPKCELSGGFINLTIYHNPQLEDRQILAAYDLIDDGTDEGWRREYLCEIIRSSTLMAIPSFSEEVHVAKLEHKKWYKYLVCGDFGGVRDFYCFHLIAYDFELEKVVFLDEKYFLSSTPTPEVLESVREWDKYTTSRVIDCPSQTQIDLSALGYAIMTPIKDKFEDTLKYARTEFYRQTVLIDESCELLILTADTQKLNKQKTDWERNDATGHADALMSGVYGLRSVDRTTDLRDKPRSQDVFVPERLREKTIEDKLKSLSYR